MNKEKDVRILRLRSYYNPEKVAASHLVDDLDEAFYQAGFVSINIAPTPCRGVTDEIRRKYARIKYEETKGGYQIVYRFDMFREGRGVFQRAVRYILCSLIEYIKGCKIENVDLVYSSSTPPTQGLLSALVAKKLSRKGRNVPFIYNLQDVFPDSLITTGLTQEGSILWKIGRLIEDYTYENASHIITISDSIKKNLIEKGVSPEKITVISNWIDLDTVVPVNRENNRLVEEYNINPNKFLIVYAGNLGIAQGVDTLKNVADKLSNNSDIEFIIFGGGSNYSELKRLSLKINNLSVFPLLPLDRVSEVYSLGDVSLITCKKGVGKSGMPSKTWSIMACNTPIIASYDRDSDLAKVLYNSGAGICVEPDNPQAMVDAILTLYYKWKDGTIRIGDYRGYVSENASKYKCVARYVHVINSIIEKNK